MYKNQYNKCTLHSKFRRGKSSLAVIDPFDVEDFNGYIGGILDRFDSTDFVECSNQEGSAVAVKVKIAGCMSISWNE